VPPSQSTHPVEKPRLQPNVRKSKRRPEKSEHDYKRRRMTRSRPRLMLERK
jgi:hypothetical protein